MNVNRQLLKKLAQVRAARLAAKRGVTLVEILIVLAIVGLIAGSVAAFAVPKFKAASIDTTRQAEMQAQPIADKWHAEHPDECPTVEKLKSLRELSPSFNSNDAWGKPFKFDCSGEDVVMISAGPDGKEGTEDDIKVPAPAKKE